MWLPSKTVESRTIGFDGHTVLERIYPTETLIEGSPSGG